ncbi:hypothetical protein NC653_040068 [Populus alba x Populus x berolinensis]|uniref:Uncharacterized protein n=1 Tax=Populus alba x Populus x berolinensis TaxID=444605 RepID=A0AAD6PRB0_9ROSI|nr:hypothetical protein NC653_040068 [Populus alba x Populus x berolinensis]
MILQQGKLKQLMNTGGCCPRCIEWQKDSRGRVAKNTWTCVFIFDDAATPSALAHSSPESLSSGKE